MNMIKVNETTKFTPRSKYYLFTKILLIITLLSIIFSISGDANFFAVFSFLAVIFGLPFFIFISLTYNSWSFLVDENNIIINYGILVKKSKMIPFDKIQSINRRQGILMGFFNITNIDIWTSSPNQFDIQDGKSSNKPDGNIVLTNEDADWLQRFISYSPDKN